MWHTNFSNRTNNTLIDCKLDLLFKRVKQNFFDQCWSLPTVICHEENCQRKQFWRIEWQAVIEIKTSTSSYIDLYAGSTPDNSSPTLRHTATLRHRLHWSNRHTYFVSYVKRYNSVVNLTKSLMTVNYYYYRVVLNAIV